MTSKVVRLFASISPSTKVDLDRFIQEHCLKQDFVVEQALRYFMQSQREFCDDTFIPTRILLDDDEAERITQLLAAPPAPTEALLELMRGAKS